jgi:hypothetical protein
MRKLIKVFVSAEDNREYFLSYGRDSVDPSNFNDVFWVVGEIVSEDRISKEYTNILNLYRTKMFTINFVGENKSRINPLVGDDLFKRTIAHNDLNGFR